MSEACVKPAALRFTLLSAVPHMVTGRNGGVSQGPFRSLNLGMGTDDVEQRVLQNRDRAAALLEKRREEVLVAGLRHGKDVAVFRRGETASWPCRVVAVRDGSEHRERRFIADGWVSDVPGLTAMFTFADCVPLVLYDGVRQVVGAAHAGWRGSAAGVGPAVVAAMRSAFGSNPADIVAAIGPSIGPCCYDVGREVLDAFAMGEYAVAETREGRRYLDLQASNQRQLMKAGIAETNIELSGVCTSCSTGEYFSHRAQRGLTGRFALFVGLPD